MAIITCLICDFINSFPVNLIGGENHNEGNVYVETYDELKRELRRNYDVNNISYTGVEGDSMYFWLEPSETMVGEFNKDENIAWFKPSN